jgi:hypothetical protein
VTLSPGVRLQQLGPQTWRVSVPGRYLTVAEGPLERDMAATVASGLARRKYAEAWPTDREDWR